MSSAVSSMTSAAAEENGGPSSMGNHNHVIDPPRRSGLFSWVPRPYWRPTSAYSLFLAEQRVLEAVTSPREQKFVSIAKLENGKEYHINTIIVGDPSKPPLVLMHGFGGSGPFWIKSLDAFAKDYRVYAVDLAGFGRSSRMPFSVLKHIRPTLPNEVFSAAENTIQDDDDGDDAADGDGVVGGVQAAPASVASVANAEKNEKKKKKPSMPLGTEIEKLKDCTLKVSPMLAETYFIETFEAWRKSMGEELGNGKKFTLCGHSMGGYLAASYALKYPQNVDRLILADPWGFPEKPADANRRIPLRWRILAAAFGGMTNAPLSIVRTSGPMGPWLVHRFRPDFFHRFEDLFPNDKRILDYIYEISAQKPAMGEHAFGAMTRSLGFAALPMLRRIHRLDESIPVLLIRGSHSWMRRDPYLEAARSLKGPVIVRECAGGHHVYADDVDAWHAAFFGDPSKKHLFRDIYVHAGNVVRERIPTPREEAASTVDQKWSAQEEKDERLDEAAATITNTT
eukprot:ANDGO_04164.mRNA.1 Abhydrolase domain-containing protein lid-1